MPTIDLKDILGTCEFIFSQRVAQQIKFGTKGRVLMCVKDSEMESGYTLDTYKTSLTNVDDDDMELRLQQIWKRNPLQVQVFTHSGTLASHSEALQNLAFDWIFSLDAESQVTVQNFAKTYEVFGLVYNLASDSKWVVSVNNPSAKLANGAELGGSSTITGYDLLPIIAGACAGCDYDKSITNYVFDELEEVTAPSAYAEGQVTLYNEEEGVRVASPVTTLLTTTSTENTADMQSIAIMEGVKRFKTDINYTFRTGYKGRYKNKYDNQMLFISACKGYIKRLCGADILDEEYDNTVDIDVQEVRDLWIESGKDEDVINQMSDAEIRRLTYKKVMALIFDVKFLDAIESCKIRVQMY